MATFTTVSVLGGSQEMPDWMFGQESSLESLRTMELGDGTENEESDEGEPVVILDDESEEDEESSSRMIDTPFDLFSDD